jgi:3-methyladenine DNA glycosylase AlkD
MTSIIEQIRIDLIKNSENKTRESGERFFKEQVVMYGVKSAVVTSIGKEHFKYLADKSKETIFSLCDELWSSGIMEESFIACNWSYNVRKGFLPEDFKVFEIWVEKYVTNWASCDTFCNHTIGTFLEMYSSYIKELKRWAVSGNRWMRRASAVSLIVPAKKGLFFNEIIELAEILLQDKDDMVQKGYGWLLKVTSQVYLEQVFEFIMQKKDVMPRTSLRYAIEKMPADMKAEAMKKL